MEEGLVTLNLRRRMERVPRWKKRQKIVSALKNSVRRITRRDRIVVSQRLNEMLWREELPPTKIRVRLIKEDERVRVELVE